MTVFRHFKQQYGVDLSATTGSPLTLEKKALSFKRIVGGHLSAESSMGKRRSHMMKDLI